LVCREVSPQIVAIETGHPTLARQVEHYGAIPPVRWMGVGSRNKLVRALPAIMMGETGKIALPAVEMDWQGPYVAQLSNFTGVDDEADDMVDDTSWACQVVQQIRTGPLRDDSDDGWPCVLIPGREMF